MGSNRWPIHLCWRKETKRSRWEKEEKFHLHSRSAAASSFWSRSISASLRAMSDKRRSSISKHSETISNGLVPRSPPSPFRRTVLLSGQLRRPMPLSFVKSELRSERRRRATSAAAALLSRQTSTRRFNSRSISELRGTEEEGACGDEKEPVVKDLSLSREPACLIEQASLSRRSIAVREALGLASTEPINWLRSEEMRGTLLVADEK